MKRPLLPSSESALVCGWFEVAGVRGGVCMHTRQTNIHRTAAKRQAQIKTILPAGACREAECGAAACAYKTGHRTAVQINGARHTARLGVHTLDTSKEAPFQTLPPP